MDTWIKINSQTAGRDKIARLLQYLTRVAWHRLQQHNKDGVNGLKNFEFQLGTFRRLLRFGKCLDVLYSIIPLFKHADPTVRYTVILSKLCSSLFLFADHVLWFARADVCTVDTDKWGRIANKYWMYSIVFSLVRDFYEIIRAIKAQKRDILSQVHSPNDIVTSFPKIVSSILLVQTNRKIVVDLIKNGCDIFIPLAATGTVKLSPGAIGWLGAISSLAALLVLVEPTVKMSPA